MKVFAIVACLCTCAGAFAQGRGGGGGMGGARGGGMGGGVQRGPAATGIPRGAPGFRGGFTPAVRPESSGRFGGVYGAGYYAPYAPWLWDSGYSAQGYGYQAAPNITVIYPPAAAEPAVVPLYVERARPVMHEYDSSGREVVSPPAAGTASPTYLIAFEDHVIRAASSYRVEGNTLRYVTLQHEEMTAPLRSVDREFTLRLNQERGVTLQLPDVQGQSGK
jgi:hypothetical protein